VYEPLCVKKEKRIMDLSSSHIYSGKIVNENGKSLDVL
jgi:hypothetical protein